LDFLDYLYLLSLLSFLGRDCISLDLLHQIYSKSISISWNVEVNEIVFHTLAHGTKNSKNITFL
ncbi:hypothetical protein DJ528_11450, partial [Sulfolobus sp. B5]